MALEKFMFDRSFDIGGAEVVEAPVEEAAEVEEEPEVIVPTFSEQELEVAKEEAFAKGREEALSESATAIEAQIVEATKSIGEKLDALVVGQLLANKDIFADAVRISQAITKKTFPYTTIEQKTAEIEDVVRQVLAQVMEEPRVGIQVNPAIEALLQERIEQISSDTHFDGRLYVTANDSVEEGDCKIEWSSGGAERNLKAIIAGADELIEATLGSLDGGYVPASETEDLEELERDRAQRSQERESNISNEDADGMDADETTASEPTEPVVEASEPDVKSADSEPENTESDEPAETPKTETDPQKTGNTAESLDEISKPNTDATAPDAS